VVILVEKLLLNPLDKKATKWRWIWLKFT
jgi:hypothetical protein